MLVRPTSYAPPVAPARPLSLSAAPPPAISDPEAARIAASFPEQPPVSQKLYGPDRTVQAPAERGLRLDLTA